MLTWQLILDKCPELASLKADARSIAEHERWSWYERWLPFSNVFKEAIRLVADRLDGDLEEIRRIVLAELLAAYRRAVEGIPEPGPTSPKPRRWKAKPITAPQGYTAGRNKRHDTA